MYSIERTSGIAPRRAMRSSSFAWEMSSCRSATTPTLFSTYRSEARKPACTIQKEASRRSISIIVAVAARLMAALRQKPCQARRMLKAKNESIDPASAGPVVAATDLVAHDPALFEGDHALAEGGDAVGVVGGHEHGHPQL